MKRAAAVLFAVVVLASCSGANGDQHAAARDDGGARQTLMVIGSGTALGDNLPDPLRDAWPRLLYLDAFPRATVFVNAAARDQTTSEAVTDQIPLVRELHPRTVIVWIGANDVTEAVPIEQFRRDVTDLLEAIRSTRVHSIFVGQLPGLGPATPSYNAVLADASARTGALLVSRTGGSRTVVDDDLPEIDDHRAVARAFEQALEHHRS
jgi:GDSL-like Lipase/Acylhydrolase family